jgi:hypothetical protein
VANARLFKILGIEYSTDFTGCPLSESSTLIDETFASLDRFREKPRLAAEASQTGVGALSQRSPICKRWRFWYNVGE